MKGQKMNIKPRLTYFNVSPFCRRSTRKMQMSQTLIIFHAF